MKRAIVALLLFLFSATTVKSETNLFPPLQPIKDSTQNYSEQNISQPNEETEYYNNDKNNNNISNNTNLSKIEYTLFGQTYEEQNISTRLSRIEKSLFSRTFTNTPYGQRIDNIISNFNQVNKYPDISKNELNRLETKVFNQNFVQMTSEARVERLEEKMFGAAQSGNLKTRLENLKTAVRYQNNNNNNYPPIVNSGWKGIGARFGNSFWGGTMTGFTPPIGPAYSNYGNDPFMNLGGGNYGMNGGYRTNTGNFREYGGFSNVGTGAGVTILD